MMPESEVEFYAAAERRIWRWQICLGVAGAGGAWILGQAPAAAGFAAGAAISALNFYWLKQAIDVLTTAASGAESAAGRRKRRRLIWKFLARYLLIALAAYGILRYTGWNVAAFLVGLFLFAAAILVEICWEILGELIPHRHGRT